MKKNQNLPKKVKIVNYNCDDRLYAPSAVRNAESIVKLVKKTVTQPGNALEIASGTGQHVVKLASALPHLKWQPSDVEKSCLKSINCWSNDQHLTNLKTPCLLDATKEGWAKQHLCQDLILLVNLLHLIGIKETKILVNEMPKAMSSNGYAIIYGPFMRSGKLTTKNDIEFHHSLINTNPDLGYKNDEDMLNLFKEAGLVHISTEKMPANNLAFILKKL